MLGAQRDHVCLQTQNDRKNGTSLVQQMAGRRAEEAAGNSRTVGSDEPVMVREDGGDDRVPRTAR